MWPGLSLQTWCHLWVLVLAPRVTHFRPGFHRAILFLIRSAAVPYEWSCYSTVEEVEALLSCLSIQGLRESELKKALKEKLPGITDGILKRFVWPEGDVGYSQLIS